MNNKAKSLPKEACGQMEIKRQSLRFTVQLYEEVIH